MTSSMVLLDVELSDMSSAKSGAAENTEPSASAAVAALRALPE
jgi:hypothetical protein